MDILILCSGENRCGNMKNQELIFIVVVVIFIALIIKLMMPNKKEVIIRDRAIIEIDPIRPIIALTFDDGPNYEYTIPILDILYEYKSLATFFIIGKNIKDNEEYPLQLHKS